jgi:glycine/D-amino acid oxidase-like deaminating enzyme
MGEGAEVIVIGAGLQGASLAFRLAQRGVDVLVAERSTVAPGATGRSSGFLRMHHDLDAEARLAWDSFPTFVEWEVRSRTPTVRRSNHHRPLDSRDSGEYRSVDCREGCRA